MIKVSDFGLTEDVYARNYFRQGREDGVVKLPVKWMSPESLNDGVFSEKTDVVHTNLEVERCTVFSDKLIALLKVVCTCGLAHTISRLDAILSLFHTVVIWDHLLGDLQWW